MLPLRPEGGQGSGQSSRAGAPPGAPLGCAATSPESRERPPSSARPGSGPRSEAGLRSRGRRAVRCRRRSLALPSQHTSTWPLRAQRLRPESQILTEPPFREVERPARVYTVGGGRPGAGIRVHPLRRRPQRPGSRVTIPFLPAQALGSSGGLSGVPAGCRMAAAVLPTQRVQFA